MYAPRQAKLSGTLAGLMAACLALAAPASVAAAPDDANGAWRRAALWDDGNAEFCAYEVSWQRYGSLFEGRALLILVKEPWAPDLDVKADRPRPDGFDVLKLNHVRDVATGIYTYHQMASVFTRRDDGRLRKLAATNSEGCGISTAEMTGGELTTRSYFDGQGERRQPWSDGSLPEDGLPSTLRDYVAGAAPARVSVFPSLLAGRFAALEPMEYRLSRRDAGAVETPAGRLEAVELILEAPGSRLAYLFERAAPHRLLHYSREDGTVYRLAKCERIPYWTMNRPGGEEWLPENLR